MWRENQKSNHQTMLNACATRMKKINKQWRKLCMKNISNGILESTISIRFKYISLNVISLLFLAFVPILYFFSRWFPVLLLLALSIIIHQYLNFHFSVYWLPMYLMCTVRLIFLPVIYESLNLLFFVQLLCFWFCWNSFNSHPRK